MSRLLKSLVKGKMEQSNKQQQQQLPQVDADNIDEFCEEVFNFKEYFFKIIISDKSPPKLGALSH